MTNAPTKDHGDPMSGPLRTTDVDFAADSGHATDHALEVTPSRNASVGPVTVRRALPQRTRRTIGAWCFADHLGPETFAAGSGPDIGPHPHAGLQTVTWLIEGELVHHDSLGSEQTIRPGQLNLMTAGSGVAHAEEATSHAGGAFHGIQLWVAQPEASRHGAAAFEHHGALPNLALERGTATVLIGDFGGITSPARHDSELVGAELALSPGASIVPLSPNFEHAVVVLDGAIALEDRVVVPGELAYLGLGRDECAFRADVPSRALLLGGVPFPEPILMWWNFVARTRDEMVEFYTHWSSDDGFFGTVTSPLARIPVAPPPWLPTH
jgi:quercetin 2,3-dioxygenase